MEQVHAGLHLPASSEAAEADNHATAGLSYFYAYTLSPEHQVEEPPTSHDALTLLSLSPTLTQSHCRWEWKLFPYGT